MELAEYMLETLRQDGEFILYRGQHRRHTNASPPSILAVTPVSERPALGSLRRLEHAYALRAELDPAWAVQPLALTRHQGREMLILTDPGGEPLDRWLGRPMALTPFLRLAIGLAAALCQLHGRGLIHKDIKPAHVLVNGATDQVWLMGFGIASRLPRERQSPEPPESIAGTLAYMAPEQTGRMNRSIDSRSDLYALGVTLYELLTGMLPFTAADAMEWVHCHIARQPVPPRQRVPEVPAPVSAIIVKLLAKTAEERYQTAAGVEADLRWCLTAWESRKRIDPFPLAAHDRSDRLRDARATLWPGRAKCRRSSMPLSRSSPEAHPLSCWSQAIPASASPRWSMSCTRRSCCRAAYSSPANLTSTSAISRMPRWRKRSRA